MFSQVTESGIDFRGYMCEVFYQTVIFVNGMPCNMNINIMCKGRLKSLSDYPAMWSLTLLHLFGISEGNGTNGVAGFII